jgi:hypothetical protein
MLAILYNKYYMGIIFLTVIAMPFLLFGLLCYIYGRVRAELVSVIHVANKNDTIPVSIQLNNPTIFPVSNLRIYLTYKNAYSHQKLKKTILASLDCRTKTSVICNLTSEYAGNLIINLEGIRIYDYLKLFSLKKKQKGELKVAVLPCFYELQENNIINKNTTMVESDNYSQVKSGDDPSEVFAIREYREGDRPQRIHWKLSRKQGQLMIKEFSDPLNCSILLFVNLCVPQDENILHFMDAILECALSLSYSFLMKGQLHYLSWYDEKHGACTRIRVTEEKDLFEAVDGLLHAEVHHETTDALMAYLAEHQHDQYTELFYVTGEISADRMNSLSMLKAQTKQMILINNTASKPGAEEISEEITRFTGDMGIELWPVKIANVRRDIEQLKLG